MSYVNSHRFSLGRLAAACIVALAVNGSVLLGFNHLAQSSDAPDANAASQSAGAQTPATQVAL